MIVLQINIDFEFNTLPNKKLAEWIVDLYFEQHNWMGTHCHAIYVCKKDHCYLFPAGLFIPVFGYPKLYDKCQSYMERTPIAMVMS